MAQNNDDKTKLLVFMPARVQLLYHCLRVKEMDSVLSLTIRDFLDHTGHGCGDGSPCNEHLVFMLFPSLKTLAMYMAHSYST